MKFRFLKIVLLLLPMSVFAQDKLIFAVDIIRHGDRAPTSDISYPSYTWPEGLGQLTPIGMHQELQNGINFRQEYIHSGLLTSSYETGTMYVRSTDYDRTLMSAESVLIGLYPPGTGPYLPGEKFPVLIAAYQPVPIHTESKGNDKLFCYPEKQRSVLLQKYVFSSPKWQAENTKLQSHYAHWSEATGMKIKTLSDVIMLGDAIYIRQIHHVPLPQGLSVDDINTIITVSKWAVARLFYPREVSRPLAHNLLMAIDTYFIDASQNKISLKYVLYSGHDATILSVLSALGSPLDTQVPYASDLKFELTENDAQQYFVVVSFNGKPVNIPACGSNQCPLSQFIKINQ